jgi:rRNA maturation endonuclease Nob1
MIYFHILIIVNIFKHSLRCVGCFSGFGNGERGREVICVVYYRV